MMKDPKKDVKVTDKQPKQKENVGSLLKLFQSELFTLDMCLQYLNKKNEPGIHDYLVNKLYHYPDRQISFYIPELCYLLIKRESSSLERYLLDKCTKTLELFLKVSFYFLSSIISNPNSDFLVPEGLWRVCKEK